MKKVFWITLLGLSISLVFDSSLEARGGGRGGGAGRGGGRIGGMGGGMGGPGRIGSVGSIGGAGGINRGYQSIDRSPSMSRAMPRNDWGPRTPVAGNYGLTQPYGQNIGQSINRAQAQDFIGTNSFARNAIGQNLSSADIANRMQSEQGIGNNLRQNFGQRNDLNNLFDRGFWARHGLDNYGYGYVDPLAYSNWGAATSWLGWSAVEPLYYTDGYTYPTLNTPVIVPQTQTIYQQVTPVTTAISANQNWLPLGVFALTSTNVESSANPNMFLQLALNKNGVISGTFYNASFDSTFPITGLVDPTTQLAQWKISNQGSAIAETSIYNLTQNQSTVQFKYPNGQVQNMFLVRINKQ